MHTPLCLWSGGNLLATLSLLFCFYPQTSTILGTGTGTLYDLGWHLHTGLQPSGVLFLLGELVDQPAFHF